MKKKKTTTIIMESVGWFLHFRERHKFQKAKICGIQKYLFNWVLLLTRLVKSDDLRLWDAHVSSFNVYFVILSKFFCCKNIKGRRMQWKLINGLKANISRYRGVVQLHLSMGALFQCNITFFTFTLARCLAAIIKRQVAEMRHFIIIVN